MVIHFRYLLVAFAAMLAVSCRGLNDGANYKYSRTATAIARQSIYCPSYYPYYGYGYDESVRQQENELADKIKTWDNTQQIVPWEDLAASMHRQEMPESDLGCVYEDKKDCPGCHRKQIRIYYRQKTSSACDAQEGWVVLCLNCRKQVKFESTK